MSDPTMFLTRLVLFFCFSFLAFCPGYADEGAATFKVMTFNIRFGNSNAPEGENTWPHRREMVMERIRVFDPDVLGLQEALRGQLDEIVGELPQYVAVGVGRKADGGGEYSSLLFRRARFDVLNSETFWLSDTPKEPGSMSWGNQLPRICTWARLLDRQSSRRFTVFNTHWDHQSQASRERSGRLMADRVVTPSDPREPVIGMGDFNAGERNLALVPFAAAGLRDTFRDLHSDATEVGTFNAFQGRTDGEKIDAVFVSRHWKTVAAVIDRTHRDGNYPSDHFPVTATLKLDESVVPGD